MTKHSHSPYTITYSLCLTIQTENTTSITSPTQTHNILQHSKAKKNTIFNNDRYTTNIPTDPHTVTTTGHSSHPCPAQNKQISLPQIILTQSRRQNTSITTMPPL